MGRVVVTQGTVLSNLVAAETSYCSTAVTMPSVPVSKPPRTTYCEIAVRKRKGSAVEPEKTWRKMLNIWLLEKYAVFPIASNFS